MNFSDREILMDLLVDAKYISSGLHQALLESATDRVRSALTQLHDDEMASHRMIFDLMKSRGYYQVQPATGSGIYQQGMSMGGFMGAQAPAMGGGMLAGQGMGPAQQLFSPAPDITGRMMPGGHPGQ